MRGDCVDIPLVIGDCGSGICIPLVRGDCGYPSSEKLIVEVVLVSLLVKR